MMVRDSQEAAPALRSGDGYLNHCCQVRFGGRPEKGQIFKSDLEKNKRVLTLRSVKV